EGRREREVSAARALRQKLEREPDQIKDKIVLSDLRKFTADPDTANEALSAMAALPGPVGPDLLYAVWTGTTGKTDVTELAQALVYSKDVRPKASPALSVALDLRAAQTCEQNRDLLPRVLNDGDQRALASLAKLNKKTGCGPTKLQDC